MSLRQKCIEHGEQFHLDKDESNNFNRLPNDRGKDSLSTTFAGFVKGVVGVSMFFGKVQLLLDAYSGVFAFDEQEVERIWGLADLSHVYFLQRGMLLDTIWEPKQTGNRANWTPEDTVLTREGKEFLRIDKYATKVLKWKKEYLSQQVQGKRYTPELVRLAIKLGIKKRNWGN